MRNTRAPGKVRPNCQSTTNKVLTKEENEVMVESEDGVEYPKRQFVCKAIPAVG